MPGAGKDKEAGTKSWGRPFWTMLQGLCLTLPLGGCLLTGDKPEAALDIPALYKFGPRKAAAGWHDLTELEILWSTRSFLFLGGVQRKQLCLLI